MREEGHAAVTSRKLAGRAGLKPQLVHYYFHTMDHLFLALFAQVAEELLRKQEVLLASDRPVQATCDIAGYPTDAILYVQFMAVGNHRKALRTAIAAFMDTYRKRQSNRLAELIRQKEAGPGRMEAGRPGAHPGVRVAHPQL